MAKSNAEIQAAYRQRHLKDEAGKCERINTLVSVHAKRALERLATHYGVTQREALERLLAKAEKAVANKLDGQQQTDYYEKRGRQSGKG